MRNVYNVYLNHLCMIYCPASLPAVVRRKMNLFFEMLHVYLFYICFVCDFCIVISVDIRIASDKSTQSCAHSMMTILSVITAITCVNNKYIYQCFALSHSCEIHIRMQNVLAISNLKEIEISITNGHILYNG